MIIYAKFSCYIRTGTLGYRQYLIRLPGAVLDFKPIVQFKAQREKMGID